MPLEKDTKELNISKEEASEGQETGTVRGSSHKRECQHDLFMDTITEEEFVDTNES